MTKAIVIVLLLLIAGSLFSALTFIYKDRGQAGRHRAATALTLRISLSILLFLMLMAGFYFGLIPAGGLR